MGGVGGKAPRVWNSPTVKWYNYTQVVYVLSRYRVSLMDKLEKLKQDFRDFEVYVNSVEKTWKSKELEQTVFELENLKNKVEILYEILRSTLNDCAPF